MVKASIVGYYNAMGYSFVSGICLFMVLNILFSSLLSMLFTSLFVYVIFTSFIDANIHYNNCKE